jgi:hypothetical protein
VKKIHLNSVFNWISKYRRPLFQISRWSKIERGCLSKLRTRYRKAVGEYKYIESDFYSNGSPNDDLDDKFLERLLEMLLAG